jgi:hypothetical protein
VETATQERTSRLFEQTMPNSEATATSLGVAQRLIGPLTELSIIAAKENARLTAELQITALEAVHDSHAAALRWQPAWTDALTDPLRLYQRGLAETFEATQRALTLMGTSARLVAQAADRLQTAATETGRRIRETLNSSPGMRETRG